VRTDLAPSPGRPRGQHVPALLFALAALTVLAGPACTTTKDVALALGEEEKCYQNTDCTSGLICALGACRAMCAGAADCGADGTCVDNGDVAVCEYGAK
jgi:hypothetical protein